MMKNNGHTNNNHEPSLGRSMPLSLEKKSLEKARRNPLPPSPLKTQNLKCPSQWKQFSSPIISKLLLSSKGAVHAIRGAFTEVGNVVGSSTRVISPPPPSPFGRFLCLCTGILGLLPLICGM